MVVTVSFKQTEKELYEWIVKHSNYSGFIKDILKEEMQGIKPLKTKVNKVESSKLIELDF